MYKNTKRHEDMTDPLEKLIKLSENTYENDIEQYLEWDLDKLGELKMKYGKNNQTAVYGKAGGELALTKSIDLVYDFSGYPLLGGDVVANDSQDGQDGVINGVDFAYIKSRSLIHETVNEGGYLQGDLDGNCQVNSNDVNILKMSLREKQGELY